MSRSRRDPLLCWEQQLPHSLCPNKPRFRFV